MKNDEYSVAVAHSAALQTLSSLQGAASRSCQWGHEPNSALLLLDPYSGHIQVLSLHLPMHSPCQASSQKPSRSSMPQSWHDSGCHAGEHHVVGRGNPLWWPCALPVQQDEACAYPVMAGQLPYGKLMCWQVRRMGEEGSLGLWQVLQHKVQPATMRWWITSSGPCFNVQILHPLFSGIAHVWFFLFFQMKALLG